MALIQKPTSKEKEEIGSCFIDWIHFVLMLIAPPGWEYEFIQSVSFKSTSAFWHINSSKLKI